MARVFLLVALLATSPLSLGAEAKQSHLPRLDANSEPATDRTLDTALTWERSVQDASVKAEREGKLVFVIHVSGDFEKPEFT